jgi:hypothetical protein
MMHGVLHSKIALIKQTSSICKVTKFHPRIYIWIANFIYMYGLAFLPMLLLWIKLTHHCESPFLAFRFYPHPCKGGGGGGGGGGFVFLGLGFVLTDKLLFVRSCYV